MPTGVSSLLYPTQPIPPYQLVIDDSYFLIKIHDTQAFFPANILAQADHLLFSSSVGSSFNSGPPIQSLYKLQTIQKNSAFHLGVEMELTDWLPARATDNVKITLKYTVVRGTLIKSLGDKLDQLHLATKLSLFRPDAAVAIKVTEIAGQLLSYFLHEGEAQEIFSWTIHLNLAELKAGYYVVIGSLTDEMWPSMVEIDMNGRLTRRNGQELSRLSYAVIQVLALKRRGTEVQRGEIWGELLQTAKDEIFNTTFTNQEDRDNALQDWRVNLSQVRSLARKDRNFLQREVDEVIANAQHEIEQRLLPRTSHESDGLDIYPDEWQKVLGVSRPQELRKIVRDYHDSLEFSKRLMHQYNLHNIKENLFDGSITR